MNIQKKEISPPAKQVVVIGGGAAGLMAAGRVAELNIPVTLVERMEIPGKKLLITGKGRCNITNTAPLKEQLSAFGRNGKFLHGAFHRFFRDELLSFFHSYGVATTIERGGRVFPVSEKAADIVAALVSHLKNKGGRLITGGRVADIEIYNGSVSGVQLYDGTKIPAAAVILATGGLSYPNTGSTGDGFKLAKQLGHRVSKLYPALVPLLLEEIEFAQACQGVSLKNIRLTAYACDKTSIPNLTINHDYGRGTGYEKPPTPIIESRFGEMLFTHFGIGGPVTLLMSNAVAQALDNGKVSVTIDLKPALTHKELDLRLQRELSVNSKKQLPAILKELLPSKMILPVAAISGIESGKTAAIITAKERRQLVKILKCLSFNVRSPLPLTSAMVTAGGVELNEIEPRTMASKLVKGLYCAGEILNLDADTGGYNLQAAFSTGWLAGDSAARFVRSHPI